MECNSCLFSEVPLELVKSYRPEQRYVIETEDIYERACLYYRITSSQTYVKQVTTTRAISMANTSLSAGTVKPIAISLVVSEQIDILAFNYSDIDVYQFILLLSLVSWLVLDIS